MFRQRPGFRKGEAFTLVEALVVVSIIALLAVLGMGLFGSSIEKVQAAKCLTQMKQVGLALNIFASDNNEEYPRAYNGTNKNTSWMWDLIPYLNLPEDAMGPSPLPRVTGILVCPTHEGRGDRSVSYGLNAFIDPSSGYVPQGFKRISISLPAQRILMVEMDRNSDTFWPTAASDVSHRHNGGTANYLFVDGHAEAIAGTIPPSDSRWR